MDAAAAAGQGDVVALAVQRLQERHEVLVVGKLLGDGERHDHHVYGGVAFGQSAEERRDWPVQLLYGALGGGRTVVVSPGVTHSWETETTKNFMMEKTKRDHKWRIEAAIHALITNADCLAF